VTQDDRPEPEWDRGALMRQWLIRLVEDRPFSPFVIRLEGGFELNVPTTEMIGLEPGVLVATVYQGEDVREVFPIDRIVSLRKTL
jgi:hypothetical protein